VCIDVVVVEQQTLQAESFADQREVEPVANKPVNCCGSKEDDINEMALGSKRATSHVEEMLVD
jgi:hypothetical protein